MDFQRLIPGFWTQNEPTDLEWDRALNEAMDAGNITEIEKYTANVGGLKVWIQNWPYAYGYLYHPECKALSKVATRKRLRKAIIEASIAKALADSKKS